MGCETHEHAEESHYTLKQMAEEVEEMLPNIHEGRSVMKPGEIDHLESNPRLDRSRLYTVDNRIPLCLDCSTSQNESTFNVSFDVDSCIVVARNLDFVKQFLRILLAPSAVHRIETNLHFRVDGKNLADVGHIFLTGLTLGC